MQNKCNGEGMTDVISPRFLHRLKCTEPTENICILELLNDSCLKKKINKFKKKDGSKCLAAAKSRQTMGSGKKTHNVAVFYPVFSTVSSHKEQQMILEASPQHWLERERALRDRMAHTWLSPRDTFGELWMSADETKSLWNIFGCSIWQVDK